MEIFRCNLWRISRGILMPCQDYGGKFRNGLPKNRLQRSFDICWYHKSPLCLISCILNANCQVIKDAGPLNFREEMACWRDVMKPDFYPEEHIYQGTNFIREIEVAFFIFFW